MTRLQQCPGRPRIEDRAKTNEARKPWLKLGMSRRTCTAAKPSNYKGAPRCMGFLL